MTLSNTTAQLETVRLYDPVPGLPKWTGDSDRQIQYRGQTLMIPARTFVLPSLMAVHCHPRYWGNDSLSWRPHRWIISNHQTEGCDADRESFHTPERGTFIPWSDGQRNCPGKKFAQVEFVAVIARLLSSHKLVPEKHLGESDEQAQQRVLQTVNDSSVKMLLQMKNPAAIGVRWMKREEW
jgi:cytochrome P450